MNNDEGLKESQSFGSSSIACSCSHISMYEYIVTIAIEAIFVNEGAVKDSEYSVECHWSGGNERGRRRGLP